ncbi:MAG: dienelactone hydrolase family protein [Ignavibacteria bacterium]|nr:dienelactone hydrolase family protein [Ignavibacteria bacterium]
MKSFIYIFLACVLLVSGCTRSNQNEIKNVKQETGEVKKNRIEMMTADGLKIVGNYYFTADKENVRQPLIVLIHQFRSTKEQWSKDFIDSLIVKKYKVLAYDIRSHGESDKAKVNIDDLLTNSEQAPKDVDAVMKWAYKNEGVDTTKIGFAGTSIGGALGFYGRIHGGKSVVLISTGKMTFAPLTGYDELRMSMARPLLRVKNVFFISGEKDGTHAIDSKSIHDNYLDQPSELKFYDSDRHGKELIEAYPEIYTLIINWFGKTL